MEMNVSECFPESKPKIVTGRCMRLKLMLGCKIQLLMLYSLSVNPPACKVFARSPVPHLTPPRERFLIYRL